MVPVNTNYIHRWNLSFDGNSNVLVSFLERVEKLCQARGVTQEQLFTSALDLFKGKALIWFRSIKEQVASWEEIVRLLKHNFLPYDYDMLLDEIKARTQGKDEKVAIYIAVLENMFSRLSIPPREELKLRIISKNLQPAFSERLLFLNIKTITDLKNACRLIEQNHRHTNKFKQPSVSTSELIEPELTYIPNPRPRNYKQMAEVVTTTTRKCWNCSKPGHGYLQCQQPRTIFCFGCGK